MNQLNQERDGYEVESRSAIWTQILIGMAIYAGAVVAVAYIALWLFNR